MRDGRKIFQNLTKTDFIKFNLASNFCCGSKDCLFVIEIFNDEAVLVWNKIKKNKMLAMQNTAVPIQALIVSIIIPRQYFDGRRLNTSGATGMGSNFEAGLRQLDSVEYGPPGWIVQLSISERAFPSSATNTSVHLKFFYTPN